MKGRKGGSRILVTLEMFVATGVRYMLPGDWIPSGEWLVFLATMSGIDVAQHLGKRISYRGETEEKG